MPKLSLIMIVKNEERRLLNCLDSVRDIIDEAVILDTGSQDRSISLAEAWGAQVGSIPWQDDFAAARNASIAQASGDWLLHLDADEVIDPESAQHIRHVVDQDGFTADAVEVMLANYCDEPRAWRWVPVSPGSPYANRYSGYIPIPLLRLFRNGKGFHYREPVHETITQSVIDLGGTVLHRHDILIHHHGYQDDSPRRQEKSQIYLRIAREKCLAAPQDLKALHDFAEQALSCGLTHEAEDACRRALALDPGCLPVVMTLANICLNRGDLGEARELLSGLEKREDAPPQVAVGLSAIDYREGRLLQAMSRLERLLERAPAALMGRLFLARIYDRFGAPDRALRQLQLAHDSAPTVQEFSDRLEAIKRRRDAEEYFQSGLAPQALETMVLALKLDPEDPLLHNNIGVILHSMGELGKAEASLSRALHLAPGLTEAVDNLKRLRADLNSAGKRP